METQPKIGLTVFNGKFKIQFFIRADNIRVHQFYNKCYFFRNTSTILSVTHSNKILKKEGIIGQKVNLSEFEEKVGFFETKDNPTSSLYFIIIPEYIMKSQPPTSLPDIKLQLTDIGSENRALFLNDPQADVAIQLKDQMFRLRKELLVSKSEYFRTLLAHDLPTIQIGENFQPSAFKAVLSLFYGFQISFQLSEIVQYFPILHTFHLRDLMGIARKCVIENIEHQNIFEMIGMAHHCYDQEIFSVCVEQLQKQKYQQMKYNQQALLNLDLPIFKLLVKSHNQFKKKKNTDISYPKISEFLEEFSKLHNLDEKVYRDLKFSVFNLADLSASDYKEIFLDQVIDEEKKACILDKKPTLLESIVFAAQPRRPGLNHMQSKSQHYARSQSLNSLNKAQIKMHMAITFLRKKNEELQGQNNFLTNELTKLKKITQQNEMVHRQMKKDLQMLKEELLKKESREKQNKKILSQIEPLLLRLQNQIEKKSLEIDRLVENRKKSKSSKQKQKPLLKVSIQQQGDQNGHDMIVQSQFLSANFIHQMFSGPAESHLTSKAPVPKKKANGKNSIKVQKKSILQELDDDEIQELYLHRVQFDEEPRTIKKSQLPQICKFLPADFKKKSFNIIYRRSLNHAPKGENEDIRNRQQLLVLINTDFDKHIGAYISETIPSSKSMTVEDKNAFMFSVTDSRKIFLRTGGRSPTIRMSENSLLSLGEELIISSNCLIDYSVCSQLTDSTASMNGSQQRRWLAGDKKFLVRDIQIYEITDVEMEMVL